MRGITYGKEVDMEGRYVHMEGGIYGWGDNYVEESIHGRKVHAEENTHEKHICTEGAYLG